MAQDIGLRPEIDIEISIQEGCLVVVPARHQYTLEELVGGITPENRHAEVDFGSPVGREIL
jgi:antitoxin MazE